jgi:hypothetical protein
MALDPILKRIIVNPQVPGYAPYPVRVAGFVGFVGFVSAVIYGKWVAPQLLAENTVKGMFAESAPGQSH